VIAKAMERRPDRRYVSAAALRDDLQAVLDGRPVQARPPGPWRRAGDWLTRHPASVVLGGMLMLLAAAIVALYVAVLALEGTGATEFSLPGMSGHRISVGVSPTER
jgi:hypothetical protein